ncbi:MAG TPA: adenylate/guanylate cyclase domain-containing protein [Gaiellaceae bacterium]|nr:adenylate/guanylate cyclase domain-containing protein [Gaiellaceae bacterium]
MAICPDCGNENLDDARFCSYCGRPLAGRPGEAERKLVTVLFADVTGSTSLGEQLDPEDLKDVLGSYADAMRDEIEAEGGTVEKFIGDAVMAAFGVPAAHEDDATRALRAALRMRRRLDELNADLERRHGLRLAMRIGVNTGEVLAARDARPEVGMVTGDAVNAAARLEQTAEPGQILVSERTARSTREFRFRELGPLAVKGKTQPIPTVELVSEAPDVPPGQRERGIPGLHAPMVGRDHELDLLQSIYSRLAASGRAQLVTVYGDPGIGKSRLTREFLGWAEQETVRPVLMKGRCLPYGEGVTYWPLAEILKAHTGVLDSDQPDTALEKIGELAENVLAATPDPARSAAVLAFTFGLEDPRFAFDDLPPRQVRLETHDAWRAFFTGLAKTGPVIAVVEDIHWADDALLDLLEDLADRIAGPLLFLCPARPDLAQRRQGWGGGKRNFSSIFLEPLSHEDAARLVEFLLAIDELPDSAREAMLDRADGNPFFLEEIVRHLIDEGRIVRSEDRWRATDDIAEIVIPDTVQGVLAARIDLLPTEERRALRSAAVVGRVFWKGPVTRLLDGESDKLDEVLDRLEDRELVLSQVGSTVAGEREFVFKHVLTRDVAYGTLPRRDRASAHAAVAGWIESAAGERRREFTELLAHHYREAYEGTVADPGASPDHIEELRRKSLAALLEASAAARTKMLLEKADVFAEGALALATNAHERSLALEALGLCALWDYRGDGAWRNLSQAVDERLAAGVDSGENLAMLCARAVEPPTRWPASMSEAPDEERVAVYLETGFAHAGRAGEARIRLLIARTMWLFAFRREGFTDEEAQLAVQAGEEAVELALEIERPDLASAALDGVTSVDFIRGRHGRLWPAEERRLAIVEHLTDPWEVGDALQTAADVALWVGRYADALRWADEGFERSRAGPDVWRACLAWRMVARFRLGDWDGALDDLRLLEESPASTRFAAAAYFHTTARSCAAFLYELRGERAASERVELQALDESLGTATVRKIPWLARLAAHRGSGDGALAHLSAAGTLPAETMARPGILEARCDVVAALERWDLAGETVAEARRFAELGLLEALPLYADRLEGRAALARGDASLAIEALTRARDGFAVLGARWESALASLWVAEAQGAQGAESEARFAAETALGVFDELRSVRELGRARSLLSRL